MAIDAMRHLGNWLQPIEIINYFSRRVEIPKLNIPNHTGIFLNVTNNKNLQRWAEEKLLPMEAVYYSKARYDKSLKKIIKKLKLIVISTGDPDQYEKTSLDDFDLTVPQTKTYRADLWSICLALAGDTYDKKCHNFISIGDPKEGEEKEIHKMFAGNYTYQTLDYEPMIPANVYPLGKLGNWTASHVARKMMDLVAIYGTLPYHDFIFEGRSVRSKINYEAVADNRFELNSNSFAASLMDTLGFDAHPKVDLIKSIEKRPYYNLIFDLKTGEIKRIAKL